MMDRSVYGRQQQLGGQPTGWPQTPTYVAIRVLTRTLAIELAAIKVNVNGLAPAWCRRPLGRPSLRWKPR